MEEIPPQQPALSTPPSTPTQNGSPIFFGPNGLRAGWSILVYITVLFLLGILARLELHWVTKHVAPHPNAHELHPSLAIAGEAVFLLVVVLATAVMAWFERRRVAAYGLLGTDRLRQFIIGLFTGFAFLSLLVGILTLTHHLTITAAHQPVRMSLAYAAAWGLCFFLVGMTEEFALRGYLLYTLARGIRFWPAAVVLAVLFGLMHKGNPGESPFGLVAAALIALVFSLSLWRLGHLWWAIGFHMAWDWAESYFYGTADSGLVSSGRLLHAQPAGNILLSGGQTGPEGSAWVLLIIALVALFIWKTQPYRGVHLHSGNPN